MNIGTIFSGIGAPEQALLRINPNFKIVFACEWDKYARQSYLANYDIDEAHFHKNINDMDGTQYKGKVDIIIGGSPCQDFSIAGLRAGIDGQKGVLIYQYIRIIKEVMPPIFIYENVKGMLSDKCGRTLKEFIQAFREMGYHCHYDVLNSKDYGVPQNRERLFLVGFLDVEEYHTFNFAPKVKLVKRLKDVLESNVSEKYYLKEKTVRTLELLNTNGNQVAKIGGENSKKNNSITNRVFGINGISPTLTTASTGGNQEIKILDFTNDFKENKIREYIKFSPTIRSERTGLCTIENLRVRKLTPREYLRLQDFPDTFKQVVSDSQLYKQAGNSITVAVMEMIFRQILTPKNNNSLF